jgi:putative transposase
LKKQLLREGSAIFTRPNSRQMHQQEVKETQLYEQIGRLKMELEWLKKKSIPFE